MRRASLWLACVVTGAPGAALAQTVVERVRARLAADRPLASFYAARDRRPVWVGDNGALPVAGELVAALAQASRDGLDSTAYGLPSIRARLATARTPDALAELELRLSRAFLAYGSDLALGRVDAAEGDSMWTSAPDRLDVAAAFATAVASGTVAEALNAVRPHHDGYALLRLSLAWCRAIAARGGWGTVPGGPPLSPGAGGARVERLRERLIASGDLVAWSALAGEPFDSTLEEAVRRFQRRHGLEDDGRVGDATLAQLNVPVEARIRQIELNLERWRWLPHDLGGRYLMVNIPAFALDLVDQGRAPPVMAMPVVVGRPDWQTPMVSATLTQVVFSPAWNIPRAIAVQELVPLARRDPAALTRQRIHVFADSGGRETELSPDSVDWGVVTESTFTFRLVQDPGPGNPLGGVKFFFANRFDVAAHDTPDRAQFANPRRVASHGCVRLARAADLAGYLLGDTLPWTADSVRVAMARPEERWVTLPSPLPVHLTYWTAWVDEDGILQFRPDVYEWDARLAGALAARVK